MLGVQAAFLRRLDTERVVMPSRSSGGQRRYSRADIDRVHVVNGLIAEGMTLAGALRIMELQAEIADLRRQLADRGGSQ
jgi:DNA-binding transcriptional MerR regulator